MTDPLLPLPVPPLWRLLTIRVLTIFLFTLPVLLPVLAPAIAAEAGPRDCLLYTSPSPRDS